MAMIGRASTFRLTQGIYYLALGTWFGALVMLVVAAMATFATLEAHQSALAAGATVGNGGPEAVPWRRLAGAVVGEMLRGLMVVQWLCAAAALLCLGLQVTLFRDRLARAGRSWTNGLRVALVVGAFAVLLANLAWINPGVREAQGAMYDARVLAGEREQARADFERYHRLSERTTGGAAVMLAMAVLVSPFAFRVTPAAPVIERRLAGRVGAGHPPQAGAAPDEGASAYE